jgi:acyl carrier protein
MVVIRFADIGEAGDRGRPVMPERIAIVGVQAIDLDADLLGHYGLTSLNMVMLLTLVCEEAKIDLTKITEDDLSRLHTAQDIVKLMQSIRMHGVAA